MDIIVDTREHDSEWERIKEQFDSLDVRYFRSKLFVGDYQSLDNARLVVDRKKDLQELCGNVCQQHERFKAELVRAMDAGIKIVILCEHGKDIKDIEDVFTWVNPRSTREVWQKVNGRMTKTIEQTKAVTGTALYKSLCTIRDRYNVDFVFCTKDETGKMIVEILQKGEVNADKKS